MKKPLSFSAPLIQHGNMNATYIKFPFSTAEVFGKKGQVKIKALFDGKAEYRGVLSNMGGSCHILIVTQAVRQQIGKGFGETVEVQLWEDAEPRVVNVPDDVKEMLHTQPESEAVFEKLSYTHQREYIRWITEAKKPETREARKVKMVEMLLAGKVR